MQSGSADHPKLDRLCNLLGDVREVDQTRRIKGGFQPADLLPGRLQITVVLQSLPLHSVVVGYIKPINLAN